MTISKSALSASVKLPPDVLSHPLPYPDRLDYAAKIIQESIDTETTKLKSELAYVRLQRDALLEMTWLDLPAEPCESTAAWREEFAKGWMRR